MSNLPHAVFVYGTLQTGHWNNHVLRHGKHQLVGTGYTVPKFLLFDGGFPKMAHMPVHTPQDVLQKLTPLLGHVRGEVWRLDDESLMDCDRLEGHPKFYCREKIGVHLDGTAKPITAWAYIIANFPHYDRHALMVPKDGRLAWDRSERKPATAAPSPKPDAVVVLDPHKRKRNQS